MKNILKMKDKLIEFEKYTAYGNDYIVIDPIKNKMFLKNKDHSYFSSNFNSGSNSDSSYNLNLKVYLKLGAREIEFDKNLIEKICSRNYGIGSDGILLGPFIIQDYSKKDKIFGLRIFNSDGSEAEKSGNGIRIFSQYLKDAGYIKNTVNIKTISGVSKAIFHEDGIISIEMGKVEFYEEKEIEAISFFDEKDKKKFKGQYLSVGNPHFVIIMDKIDDKIAKNYGKSIEENPVFENKTNVQFMRVIDENNIEIEIFERGSGYTLASGSSACAAACTAYKKGLTNNKIKVKMPGGEVEVFVDKSFNITLKGKVKYLFSGKFFVSSFLDKFEN